MRARSSELANWQASAQVSDLDWTPPSPEALLDTIEELQDQLIESHEIIRRMGLERAKFAQSI